MPKGVDYNKDRQAGRNGRIWQEYLAGRTQESIAEDYGVDTSRISQILKEIRESIPETNVVEERLKDVERMEAMHEPQFAAARLGDKDAAQTALKIMERRAKLLGLDAATKVEHSGKVATYSIEGVDLDEL